MRKYLFYIGVSFVPLTPAWAQDIQEDEDEYYTGPISTGGGYRLPEAAITVTATGTPMDVVATGQPVTVLGEAEIASVQGADLTRALERVPGLTLTRNGGAGNFTGVRLRGAEAEQTLVVLDWVRVADPAAPGGGFDFGKISE